MKGGGNSQSQHYWQSHCSNSYFLDEREIPTTAMKTNKARITSPDSWIQLRRQAPEKINKKGNSSGSLLKEQAHDIFSAAHCPTLPCLLPLPLPVALIPNLMAPPPLSHLVNLLLIGVLVQQSLLFIPISASNVSSLTLFYLYIIILPFSFKMLYYWFCWCPCRPTLYTWVRIKLMRKWKCRMFRTSITESFRPLSAGFLLSHHKNLFIF